MNRISGCISISLLFLATAAIAEEQTGEALYVEECSNCHFEDDFSGESAEAIAGMINDIMAGKTEHRTEITGLSEDQVKKLAEYFASQ